MCWVPSAVSRRRPAASAYQERSTDAFRRDPCQKYLSRTIVQLVWLQISMHVLRDIYVTVHWVQELSLLEDADLGLLRPSVRVGLHDVTYMLLCWL